MTIRRVKIRTLICICERCGHRWTPRTNQPPVACAKCKARNWNQPARAYVRAR